MKTPEVRTTTVKTSESATTESIVIALGVEVCRLTVTRTGPNGGYRSSPAVTEGKLVHVPEPLTSKELTEQNRYLEACREWDARPWWKYFARRPGDLAVTGELQ